MSSGSSNMSTCPAALACFTLRVLLNQISACSRSQGWLSALLYVWTELCTAMACLAGTDDQQDGPSCIKGSSSFSRQRCYSASAQAVENDIDDSPSQYDSPRFFPSSPKRQPPGRRDESGPSWAHLPNSLSTSLSDGIITSPSQFRTEFDRLECKSGQLASLDTLQLVFSLFLPSAEPSQWAWLSGQLGHMLAAVSDAGVFHPDVPALGQSMRAYCLAELGQEEEARGILHAAMMAGRSTLAVDHSVRAIALTRIGEKETARDQVIRAVRRGIKPYGKGRHLTKTLADCFALFARHASDDDMVYVMRQSGHRLRQFLTSAAEQEQNPLFVEVWRSWLGRLPVSVSINDTSPQSDFFRHIHFSVLVRDTSRSEDAHSLSVEICNRGRMDDLLASDAKRLAQMLAGEPAITTSTPSSSLPQLTELPQPQARLSARDQTRMKELRARLRATLDAKDADAAEDCLAEITDVSPDPSAIRYVLHLMSALDDKDRARRVFGMFEQNGLTPSLDAYTTLIAMHGRRRELGAAEALFQTMIDNGVDPDAKAWSAVLNAHIEAGDWDGSTERWKALDEAIQLSPEVVSVVMKALVLKGSSTSRVLDMFRLVDKPTTRQWALFLQSIADSGDHQAMASLHAEMQTRSRDDPEAPKPDVYTFSILLHAYLRTNNSTRSREIYDEMLRNDIIPSSVTYSMIISSYAKGTSASSFQRAEDFAMSIYRLSGLGDQSSVDSGIRVPKGRTNENLLGPLVVAAGRENETRLASRYFDLITKDAEPSIPTFTRYLDVWRRAGEVTMVMRVWAELFALACRVISVKPALPSKSSRSTATIRQRQPDNALVMPLSIVLITLGRDKRLLDIRRVWEEVRSAGFGFDAKNFNHLAVSLAQSGDVEGAFGVVENVLVESAEQEDRHMRESMTNANVSASGVDYDAPEGPSPTPVSLEGDPTDPMFRPPNRRLEAIAHTTHFSTGASIPELLSTSPHGNLWRPHFHTLSTLDSVISQLESRPDQRAWLGLAMTEETEDDQLDADGTGSGGAVVELPEFGTCVRDPVDGRPKKTSARGLLMKLNRKYSKAMALVMFHRKKQSARRARPVGGPSRRTGYGLP